MRFLPIISTCHASEKAIISNLEQIFSKLFEKEHIASTVRKDTSLKIFMKFSSRKIVAPKTELRKFAISNRLIAVIKMFL